MIERIFDLPGLLIVLGIAALGCLLPLIIGAVRGESGLWRGIEAAILAVTGGMLARSFISILLGSANDSHGAGLAIGWGFFLVPGLIDTFTSQPRPDRAECLIDQCGCRRRMHWGHGRSLSNL